MQADALEREPRAERQSGDVAVSEYQTLAVLAGFAFVYSAVAARLERTLAQVRLAMSPVLTTRRRDGTTSFVVYEIVR